MDIGATQIVTEIASSTTSNFESYAPVFLLVGGIVLAIGVISALLDRFFPGSVQDEERRI